MNIGVELNFSSNFPSQPPLFVHERANLHYHLIAHAELVVTELLRVPAYHCAAVG